MPWSGELRGWDCNYFLLALCYECRRKLKQNSGQAPMLQFRLSFSIGSPYDSNNSELP
jgi:hypothetical protein